MFSREAARTDRYSDEHLLNSMHSTGIFWTHYCMVKSYCWRFRIVTAIFWVSKFFRSFRYTFMQLKLGKMMSHAFLLWNNWFWNHQQWADYNQSSKMSLKSTTLSFLKEKKRHFTKLLCMPNLSVVILWLVQSHKTKKSHIKVPVLLPRNWLRPIHWSHSAIQSASFGRITLFKS